MKVVTFGELMLRLAPLNYQRFLQDSVLEATFGGGEANVAVSLANFKEEVSFVTKLPNNDIAEAAIRELRGFGVDIKDITRGGDRIGIYYLEKGASMRPSKVIYDRANSAISQAEVKDFNWEQILECADWFHFTGITPALGDNVAAITLEALKVAKKNGITVSCDLNYRKKLWSKEKAGKVMGELLPYVDVVIANEEDAADVFGIKAKNSDVNSGKIDHQGYISVAEELTKRFDLKSVAITLRESISANDNHWSAMYYTQGKAYFSRKYAMHIVDRVGGGDSFGAGLIFALRKNYDPEDVIEYAVASSALKHTIQGDYNRVTQAEVEGLLKNGGSGRVQR